MKARKIIPIGSLVLFALFLLVMLSTWLLIKPPAAPAELEGVLRSEYRLLAPFDLVDHRQRPFNQKNLQGKWSFVFFGYLSCPDVCPNTLHELNSFWRLLKDETGEDPQDLQIVFVSVDPRRDSAHRLGDYIGHFNREFIAATAEKKAHRQLRASVRSGLRHRGGNGSRAIPGGAYQRHFPGRSARQVGRDFLAAALRRYARYR